MSIEADLETTTRQPPAGPLTFEEFFTWCDEDTWAEWVDGEVIVLSPSSLKHALLAGFLTTVLTAWVSKGDLGVILAAPFLMRLPEALRRGREPDLLFVSKEHAGRLLPTYLNGPADLVVEIISAESVGRDRGDKFVEYERAGIREYWLIDPDRQQAEFYALGADQRYHLVLGGASGIYRSQVVADFRLAVEWLWQDPLPKVQPLLRELGL